MGMLCIGCKIGHDVVEYMTYNPDIEATVIHCMTRGMYIEIEEISINN